MGSGIRSGVSVQANPTIMPWSPAPSASRFSPLLSTSPLTSSATSTPLAISLDCSWTDTAIPQDWESNPKLDSLYPASRMVWRATEARSIHSDVVLSSP